MNCPSRTDDTFLHSDWNQNPPFLAPDLTTRQDLNGISNTREHKGGSALVGPHRDSLDDDVGSTPANESDCEKYRTLRPGVSLTQSGPPNYLPEPAIGSNYRAAQPQSSLISNLRSWTTWLFSVLVTALLLSNSSFDRYLTIANWSNFGSSNSTMPLAQPDTESLNRMERRHVKRQTCAQGGVNTDVYNTSLHVGALFIILGVSTLACAFPVLAIRFRRLRIPSSFLFFVSHFGTGVLIATAFVHLLPTAFTLLGDPCLSDFWTTDYPAMPGAIALAGIFLVTLIEMVFSPARHLCHGNGNKIDSERQVAAPMSQDLPSAITLDAPDDSNPGVTTPEPIQELGRDRGSQIRTKGPLIGRTASFSRAINRIGEDPERIYRIASAPEGYVAQREIKAELFQGQKSEFADEVHMSNTQKHNKAVMQVIMLEVGILFHSVFIGMSLSVSVGNEFVILLIAIVFHQTFEGLALGSRIGALDWPEKALQPWLMSLAYGCTTPIGQAIGIATHTLYSPDSEVGLLLVGTMNAISAGLLIFASLVELMSEDFLSDESWRVLRGRKRVIACILVFLGAFFMSLVGAWA